MITIGADPELFIIDSKTKDVVSSIGLIPGVKNDPYKPKELPNGYGIETDNILAEFNIPPAIKKGDFVDSILTMQNYIRDFVKKINPNYDIQCVASRLVSRSQLRSKEANLFGWIKSSHLIE